MGNFLEKVDLNLNDLKGLVLSPGNIFWKQKSGALVLISSKSDFLNREMIEKLASSNHKLVIENQIDPHLQNEFVELFKAHEKELLIKEKLKWRGQIINLFSNQFSEKNFTQFEVDQMACAVFSSMTSEEVKHYLDLDIDLFKRSLSIASSYTFCAFLLGYYSDTFLKKLFMETIVSLMSFENIDPPLTLKSKLEKIRDVESLSLEDRHYLKEVYHEKNALLGERYDGSGVQSINMKEMTDLELVFVALNKHFPLVVNNEHSSIFYEIKNSEFNCENKVLTVLNKILERKENAALMSA